MLSIEIIVVSVLRLRRLAWSSAGRSRLHRSRVTLIDEIPVNHIPEGFHVFRATILVFQIIRVFPYIDFEDWTSCALRFEIGVSWLGVETIFTLLPSVTNQAHPLPK